jgi:hypothetical protein
MNKIWLNQSKQVLMVAQGMIIAVLLCIVASYGYYVLNTSKPDPQKTGEYLLILMCIVLLHLGFFLIAGILLGKRPAHFARTGRIRTEHLPSFFTKLQFTSTLNLIQNSIAYKDGTCYRFTVETQQGQVLVDIYSISVNDTMRIIAVKAKSLLVTIATLEQITSYIDQTIQILNRQ